MLTQSEILEKLRPLLEKEGQAYQKYKQIYARPAKPGETIATQTADGLETTNSANEGDYIVQNQTHAGEEYIVPGDKFNKNYEFAKEKDDTWSTYNPLGRIVAVELTPERLEALGLPAEFQFIAGWNAPMTAKTGDFMGSPPDLSEVYRLARTEFFETYRLDTTPDQ